ncbi:cysteine-rich secretory protein LCCL domain-containing 2-like [Harmonia axyridis]|uniref:cysteine-rich secretory protein LCCL domain-containing 2-like n=1 Tax=Harmonia axyridis TaxID=115357 RepID=UPI001E274DF7|nr:cysteine-rich secretory protein LCCL domain-containing 2-like [Harmonia axyridis]
MHSVLDIVILSLLLGKQILYSHVFVLPNLFPFCSNISYCHEDCLCENYQNCSVLLMDDSIRSSMLYYHNQIREQMAQYQPQPSGMTLLKYDKSLEQISECWASKCLNEYSDCFLTHNYSSTSQSIIQIILGRGQTPELITWMQELNNMVRDMELVKIHRFSHNLAQIVSDRVLSVGCAWSVSSNRRLTFVCTYGPSGGKEEDLVYKTGPICSMCPEKYACDNMEPFPKLCKPILKQTRLTTIQKEIESTLTPITVQSTEGVVLPEKPDLHSAPLPYIPLSVIESSTLFKLPQKRSNDNKDKEGSEKSHKDGLIVGVMVTLLILALICAISAVCIFTHGFGCRRYK